MSFDQPHTHVLNFSLFQIQAIAKKKFRVTRVTIGYVQIITLANYFPKRQ